MTSPHANRLADQDTTTIATDRSTVPVPRPTALVDTSTPGRPAGWAGPTGALTFLAAVWLAMASFPLYFRYDALWNDVVIAAAIAAVSLARVAKPVETRSLGWVNIVLGASLMVAPFAWGYGDATGAARAVWNDVIVGLVVVLLFGIGLLRAAGGPDRHPS
jgi:SPW repeat